jgi:hypothetical protein
MKVYAHANECSVLVAGAYIVRRFMDCSQVYR